MRIGQVGRWFCGNLPADWRRWLIDCLQQRLFSLPNLSHKLRFPTLVLPLGSLLDAVYRGLGGILNGRRISAIGADA